MTQPNSVAADLCSFIDASPSPFHVTETVASRLEVGGFRRLREVDNWPAAQGRYYVVRGGSLVAWSNEGAEGAAAPFRVVGGHTDSPNLRVKQHPDLSRAGWQLVGVEPYGGVLLNSWLDRDLGLSGRVTVRADGGTRSQLVLVDRPVLRVPQLAIHLDREVGTTGLKLNPQQHLAAVWGVGTSPEPFVGFLAEELGVEAADVLGWELMTHDLAPSRVVGRDGDLVSAPRMDNQVTCFAGTTALLQEVAEPSGTVRVLALFDHEEVGSVSDRGAASPLLETVLERIVLAAGGAREDLHRALAGSVVASGDMAHATHPNYVEKHEPQHQIAVNGGPVLKVHPNLRYATDAPGAAAFALACEQAGVPLQRYEHRADLPCGSTVGPITAGGLGVTTVDVGAPQLAMHSARELCGAQDPGMYVASLAAFLSPAG
jgi:aspartyl aminopeptidase